MIRESRDMFLLWHAISVRISLLKPWWKAAFNAHELKTLVHILLCDVFPGTQPTVVLQPPLLPYSVQNVQEINHSRPSSQDSQTAVHHYSALFATMLIHCLINNLLLVGQPGLAGEVQKTLEQEPLLVGWLTLIFVGDIGSRHLS